MFESTMTPVTAVELETWVSRLASMDRDVDDAARVDQIAVLERLKGAAAAAQARASVDLDASQRDAQAAAGVPARKRGVGVGAQIALARRDSPARGSRHLGLAKALVKEMPHTLRVLGRGQTTEWRATILARETATLPSELRSEVDRRLVDRLPTMGDREVEQAARALAYELDPTSPLRRIRGAESDRRVSIRPAPDAMARITGFLPVAQGVAVWAALQAAAGSAGAAGDERSRDQVMADTFVERLTGQARADDISIEIGLVMTDAALFGDAATPARIHADGLPGAVVPAAFARGLLRRNEDGSREGDCDLRAKAWLRRLYASPGDGTLVAMDSKRRLFDGQLRRFLVHRDQFCRTPWCGAPIRHADHIRPSTAGGPTTAENGQGLCAACNLAKEAPGWRSGASSPPTSRGRPAHLVRVTTPTGHTYDSTAPPVLYFPCHRGEVESPPTLLDTSSPLEAACQRLLDEVA